MFVWNPKFSQYLERERQGMERRADLLNSIYDGRWAIGLQSSKSLLESALERITKDSAKKKTLLMYHHCSGHA
jgi:hypothetical protein